jgi:hypothetical protein
LEIENRFLKVEKIINKKYNSNHKKFKIYQKLSRLLEEKISTLNLIKDNIKNQELLEKFEKKTLLLVKLNILSQEKILIYIDYIDLKLDNEKVKINDTKKIDIIKQDNKLKTNNQVDIQAKIKANKEAQERLIEQAKITAQQEAKIKADTNTAAS